MLNFSPVYLALKCVEELPALLLLTRSVAPVPSETEEGSGDSPAGGMEMTTNTDLRTTGVLSP